MPWPQCSDPVHRFRSQEWLVHEVPFAACPCLRRKFERFVLGRRPGRLSFPARAAHRAICARRLHGRLGPRGGRGPAQGAGPERGGGEPRWRGGAARYRGGSSGRAGRLYAGHGHGQHHGGESPAVWHQARRSADAVGARGIRGHGAGRMDGESGVSRAGLRAIPGGTARPSRKVLLWLARRGVARPLEPGGHERRPEGRCVARAVPRHGAGADCRRGRRSAGAAGPVRIGAIAGQGRQAPCHRGVRASPAARHAGTSDHDGTRVSAAQRAGPDLVRPGRARGNTGGRGPAPEPGRRARTGRSGSGAAPGRHGRAAGRGHAPGVRRPHRADAGRQSQNH